MRALQAVADMPKCIHNERVKRVAIGWVLAAVPLAGACDRGAAPPPEAQAADPGPERIVAEVNGQPIHAGQLDEVWQAGRLLPDPAPPPGAADADDGARRREALELVINGELIHQAALARDIDVSEAAIDEQLQVARSQFVSEEEFQQHLDAAGLTTDTLRARAARRLRMRAYVETVTADLRIDEAEARRLYEAQRERFVEEDQVRVAQILVRLRPGDSEERRRTARRKIDAAHRRAIAGEDFAALAREYSESPLAQRGGDLGYFPRGRMLQEFEEVVFATPTGRITPVFETPHGLNVAKVLDRRAAAPSSFEEVKTGLLMVLAREQRDDALRQEVERLRALATVRILDERLANDPG